MQLKHEQYKDNLIVPLDVYLKDLRSDLSDAYWNEDEMLTKDLQNKLDRAISAIEAGETYDIRF
jgi:hypothetical protein